jgi:pimeloyl-ACP methyl ester carboxylesterase
MALRSQRWQFLAPKDPDPGQPLFVFLPGMDGSGRLLHSQLKGLSSVFDIRCLSIPPDDLTDWGGMVEHVVQLLHQERGRGPARPIYLCGESFGGCLALQLTACHPGLIDRLILVNPASSATRQNWMQWGASLTKRMPELVYQVSTLGLLPLLISPERVPASNRRSLLRAMQSVSPASAAWRISLLTRFAWERLPLHRILQPVLILASGADRLLPSVREGGRLARGLSNSRVALLPRSGHACLLEAEVRLAHLLRANNFTPEPRLMASPSLR